MHAAVVREIGSVVIDRLLEIADHAEASGTGRINLRFQPASDGIRRSRHFEQDGKLRGISVLRFIQNNDRIKLTYAVRGFGMLQKFVGERDLVGIRHHAALKAEVAIIALHLGRDADGGLIHPTAQGNKGTRPKLVDVLRFRRTNRPAQETCSVAIAFLPVLKLRDGISNRVALPGRSRGSIDFAQVDLWTGARFVRMEQSGAGLPPQLHDVPHRREAQERGAIFRRERTANADLLLDELIPEIVVVRDQFERCRQAEIMPMVIQELEAEGVNGAKPGAIKGGQDFRPRLRAQNLFARALLHFVGGAVRESEDDETGQRRQCIGCLRQVRDAVGDGARLARTGCGDDREVAVERLREALARGLIAWSVHDQLSSSAARSG